MFIKDLQEKKTGFTAQSVGRLTIEPELPGSISGPLKKGSNCLSNTGGSMCMKY